MTPLRKLCLALLTLALPLLAYGAGSSDEPLEPEVAFQVKASALDANTVRTEWTIAPDYYLYKSKFRFSSESAGISLGEPRFPQAETKQDEIFGQVEVYHGRFTIDIPLKRQDGASSLDLAAHYQGCAELLGLCYPPQRSGLKVKLPAAAAAAAPAAPAKATPLAQAVQPLKGFGGGGGAAEDEVLEPDVAFVFESLQDGAAVDLRWTIAPGHYLYKDKFSFQLRDANGLSLGEVSLPAGEEKHDEFFGLIRVFHDLVEVRVSLINTGSGTLVVGYQGCSELTGICYPPMKKEITLNVTAAASSGAAPTAPAAGASQPPLSEQDTLAASLAGGNRLLTILTFFGLGLLLAFTPCVFPMIPILSSIIVGQGGTMTTRRAFVLSAVYVLAMALTYTVAGVIAGLFGANLQAAFQNPWILGSFSAVFVLLALSMFGFYELQLPSALQSKLTEVSNRQQGGTLAGVAIMGLLSALIVGPCVAPPLMGALIYIGQTGDPWLGGTALFALSLGMGAPLVVIGTASGKLLPRAGGWMDTVKAVFGVLLLAVAVWMLERILPAAVIMVLWALLLIGSGVYLGALEPVGHPPAGWRKLWKGMGLAFLIHGALLLIGAAGGSTDPLQPLRGLNFGLAGGTAVAGPAAHVSFKPIKTAADLERELAAASASGKPVMLDFYADWCVSCKEFEKYTFSDPGVIATLSGAVLLQADVTANDAADQALLKRFKLIGPPSLLFFGRDGEERKNYRVVGFMQAEEFRRHAEQALAN